MKYKILMLVSATFALFSLGACIEDGNRETSADTKQAQATAKSLAEAERQVGMPNIVNWKQRKTLKMIMELCDKEDLVCYAYLQNQYTGRLVYVGRCLGYGIPFSAQFTNPEKIVANDTFANGGSIFGKLPQADPNGLFMPTSSSATWLIMVDPKTKEPRPVYFEPTIVVSPFPLVEGMERVTKAEVE